MIETQTTYHIFELSSEGHFVRPTEGSYINSNRIFKEKGYDSYDDASDAVLECAKNLHGDLRYFILPRINVIEVEE